jgi:hypothetical protein
LYHADIHYFGVQIMFYTYIYTHTHTHTITSSLESSSNEILHDEFSRNLNKYSVSVNIFNINSVTTLVNFYVTYFYVNIPVT